MTAPRPRLPNLTAGQRNRLDSVAKDLESKTELTVEDFNNLRQKYKFGLDKARTNQFENLVTTMIYVACVEKGNDALLTQLKNLGEEDMNVFLLSNVQAAAKRGGKDLNLDDCVKDALRNNKDKEGKPMPEIAVTQAVEFFGNVREAVSQNLSTGSPPPRKDSAPSEPEQEEKRSNTRRMRG